MNKTERGKTSYRSLNKQTPSLFTVRKRDLQGFSSDIALSLVAKGGNLIMAEIRVGKNESLDTALKRFKRTCARDGVIAEVRKREHYEKPSVKRKKKSEAARKRKY